MRHNTTPDTLHGTAPLAPGRLVLHDRPVQQRHTLAGITAPPAQRLSPAGSNLEALDSTYQRRRKERGQVEGSILWVTLGPSSGLLGGRHDAHT